MRRVGILQTEDHAARLGDALTARGMTVDVDPAGEGGWAVWVRDDRHLEAARAALDRFRADPDADEFVRADREAEAERRRRQEDLARHQRRQVDLRRRWDVGVGRPGPVTLALIALSVGVAFATHLGERQPIVTKLQITRVAHEPVAVQGPEGTYVTERVTWREGLPEVWQGQVWRLLTPIFLHFGFLHFLFNMYWVYRLGTIIEHALGSGRLARLILVGGIGANLAEYALAGPNFGGMSGALYGLVGFVWMRGRFDPGSGVYLDRRSLVIMLAWLVLCWTGLLGPIANIAHTTGLVYGMTAGFLSSGAIRRWLDRRATGT